LSRHPHAKRNARPPMPSRALPAAVDTSPISAQALAASRRARHHGADRDAPRLPASSRHRRRPCPQARRTVRIPSARRAGCRAPSTGRAPRGARPASARSRPRASRRRGSASADAAGVRHRRAGCA
jgi:hypothetical protein